MFNLIRKYPWFLFAMFANFSSATEIDSFTLRDPNLKDSTAEINSLMNAYIQESIKEAQSWGECNAEKFIDDLHGRMGGFFWSAIENNISSNANISWLSIGLGQSIYQDFSFFLAPALYLARLGPLLRVGNYFIGSDKIGHFVTEGYSYYKILKDKNKSLDDALAFGENTEKTYFGLTLTGIYSYADLVANYHGLIDLWQKLISDDQSRSDTYVICKNKTYYQTELIDFAKIINAGWDEGINPNTYRNSTLEEYVKQRVAMIGQERGEPLTYPIAPDECRKLIGFYGAIAYRLISPKCF